MESVPDKFDKQKHPGGHCNFKIHRLSNSKSIPEEKIHAASAPSNRSSLEDSLNTFSTSSCPRMYETILQKNKKGSEYQHSSSSTVGKMENISEDRNSFENSLYSFTSSFGSEQMVSPSKKNIKRNESQSSLSSLAVHKMENIPEDRIPDNMNPSTTSGAQDTTQMQDRYSIFTPILSILAASIRLTWMFVVGVIPKKVLQSRPDPYAARIMSFARRMSLTLLLLLMVTPLFSIFNFKSLPITKLSACVCLILQILTLLDIHLQIAEYLQKRQTLKFSSFLMMIFCVWPRTIFWLCISKGKYPILPNEDYA